MILYDNVCTPCVRRREWRQLRKFARKHSIELARVDVKKQPQHLGKIWWNIDQTPLPAVEYEAEGDRKLTTLIEFLRLHVQEEV